MYGMRITVYYNSGPGSAVATIYDYQSTDEPIPERNSTIIVPTNHPVYPYCPSGKALVVCHDWNHEASPHRVEVKCRPFTQEDAERLQKVLG